MTEGASGLFPTVSTGTRMVEPKVEAAGIEPASPFSPNLRYAGISRETFGNRLAALADGEGHFAIGHIGRNKPRGGNFNCAFRIKMRADDAPLLKGLHSATCLGTIHWQVGVTSDGHDRKPQTTWSIDSKGDCLELVRLLDDFPLWSKKARDYIVWRKAVMYWNDPRRTEEGFIDWRPMANLRQLLMEGRAYEVLS